jgi:alanyl-tRNA synthetase
MPAGTSAIDPQVAAELYDTYGFPIDLTGVIARERGLSLDEDAAEAAVHARQAEGGRGSDLGAGERVDDVWFAVQAEVGDTEFLGYDEEHARATVRAIVVDGRAVGEAAAGSRADLVFDRSPFYAESGGQVGDAGTATGDGVQATISDTLKPRAGLHVHRASVQAGTVRVGQTLALAVDGDRRAAIRRNHSATHLLHLALRRVLGEHVTQKGSLVAPDRLRFDFSHGRPVSADEQRKIEWMVNAAVVENADTAVNVSSMAEAKAAGAMMLFGEKYGERVRVVKIGGESVELCGGTHVRRAGDIGSFLITSEGGIAQGVRRIEAVTGLGALEHVQRVQRIVGEAAGQVHAGKVDELPERIGRLQQDLKARDREIETLRQRLATGGGGASDDVAEVGGVKLLTRKIVDADAKSLRAAADALRDRLGSGVVVLAADTEGKATLLVAVTKDLEGRVHAGKLVSELAPHVEGRGGGRPDLAQAGGPKVAGLQAALDAAASALAKQLG